jgi:hypothetical protein
MRDLVAGVIAVALLLLALSLATTLHVFRRRRIRAREAEHELGRTVIAEIPAADDLVLFSEDVEAFHYGSQIVRKDSIAAARVLINGIPIAAVVSKTYKDAAALHPTSFEDRPEGIARDRWDVAIETTAGTVLVECGAIRERVSQELARAVFDAVKASVEQRDRRNLGSG